MGLRTPRYRVLNNGAVRYAGNEGPRKVVGLGLKDAIGCGHTSASGPKALLQNVRDLVDEQSETADARRVELASPKKDIVVDGKRPDAAPADRFGGIPIGVDANGRKVRSEPLFKPASQRTIQRKSGIEMRSDQRRWPHETSPSWLPVAQMVSGPSRRRGVMLLSAKR